MKVEGYRYPFRLRERDVGPYIQTVVHIYPDHGPKKRVEVSVSPTGRSIRVFLDDDETKVLS